MSASQWLAIAERAAALAFAITFGAAAVAGVRMIVREGFAGGRRESWGYQDDEE